MRPSSDRVPCAGDNPAAEILTVIVASDYRQNPRGHGIHRFSWCILDLALSDAKTLFLWFRGYRLRRRSGALVSFATGRLPSGTPLGYGGELCRKSIGQKDPPSRNIPAALWFFHRFSTFDMPHRSCFQCKEICGKLPVFRLPSGTTDPAKVLETVL